MKVIKIVLMIMAVLIVGGGLKAQSKDSIIKQSDISQSDTDEIVKPEFPGGKLGWQRFLMRNLNNSIANNFPKNNSKQTAKFSFIVDTIGKVSVN